MSIIRDIRAREILDSRGVPTIEVDMTFDDGSFGRASVPSGASKGSHEAYEMRDTEDDRRFFGKGVLKAIKNIHSLICNHIIGVPIEEQCVLDEILIKLDGTPQKTHLGANAMLGVSLAFARARARSIKKPLFQSIKSPVPFYLNNDKNKNTYILPRPMINILNGGIHADNALDVQEFMIVPMKATSFREALQMASDVFYVLKDYLTKKGMSTNVGDEGGFAPDISSTSQAIEYIMHAISQAGYATNEISIALDVASSSFYIDTVYEFKEKAKLKSEDFVSYWVDMVNKYPIISLEDPVAENDFVAWSLITKYLGDKIQLVGDDIFVTNPCFLGKGIQNGWANAVLIKPNQIGTLTETLRTIQMGFDHKYACIISHRSGDTEDSFIADLAVATGCGQIKVGSLSRSERLAKYNRILRIEEHLMHDGATVVYGCDSLCKETLI